MTMPSLPAETRSSHQLSWTVFSVVLLLGGVFVNQTAAELPKRVAVQFDALGDPQSFMTAGHYRLYILAFTVAIPLAVVAVMTSTYARVDALKLANRNYWLASQRIEHTRRFLVAHGIWFGTLLIALMCFLHLLVFEANKHVPVRLSNTALFPGVLLFLLLTMAWISTLLMYFRRTDRRR